MTRVVHDRLVAIFDPETTQPRLSATSPKPQQQQMQRAAQRWTGTGILQCVSTFYRLIAKNSRGDAVAIVRGHDDKVTAFRTCGIDDRLVEMLMLDMDDFANDTCQL